MSSDRELQRELKRFSLGLRLSSIPNISEFISCQNFATKRGPRLTIIAFIQIHPSTASFRMRAQSGASLALIIW